MIRSSRVARAVGFVENVARRHGVEYPVQMTVATSDGSVVWAFRYSSEGRRSLFYSTDVAKLRELHPEVEILQSVGRGDPGGGLRTARRPPRSLERGARIVLRHCPARDDEIRPFRPESAAVPG